MYNRYIPSADGTYRRQPSPPAPPRVPYTPPREACAPAPPKPPAPPKKSPCEPPKKSLCEPPKPRRGLFPAELDTGDILVLLILLLTLVDGEETDWTTTLITIAAFILLQ